MSSLREYACRIMPALLLLMLGCATAFASSRPHAKKWAGDSSVTDVDFDSPQWQGYDPRGRRGEYLGRKSLYLTSGFAFLKDVVFEDGVIEVDVATTSLTSFVGVVFRGQSADDYEIVYFRPFKSGQPDAVQYTPAFNGSAGWQLYSGEGYTTAVEIPHDSWVHVRIGVSGLALKVYFNDSDKPVLVNDDLKRGYGRGSIGLWGIANGGHFSNFRYETKQPGERRAPPKPSFAPGTLTRWELSEAFDVAQRDPEALPDAAALKSMKWQPVAVETPGMVVVD